MSTSGGDNGNTTGSYTLRVRFTDGSRDDHGNTQAGAPPASTSPPTPGAAWSAGAMWTTSASLSPRPAP